MLKLRWSFIETVLWLSVTVLLYCLVLCSNTIYVLYTLTSQFKRVVFTSIYLSNLDHICQRILLDVLIRSIKVVFDSFICWRDDSITMHKIWLFRPQLKSSNINRCDRRALIWFAAETCNETCTQSHLPKVCFNPLLHSWSVKTCINDLIEQYYTLDDHMRNIRTT